LPQRRSLTPKLLFMPKRKIKTAIAGLGRAGWNLHLKPMLAHGGYEVVAVTDPLEERCQEATETLPGCAVFESLEALLEKSDAELVVIATPSNTHFEDARRVILTGRDVILEKPMSATYAEAVTLRDLAAIHGVRIFVHHVHLHRVEIRHLRSVIASGVLGPLFHIRTDWAYYGRRWDWQTLLKNGGGQLANTGPHVLSIVLPLLGGEATVEHCELRNIKDAGDAEDFVRIVLTSSSGVTADLTFSSATALSGPRWQLLGKCGSLTSDGTTSKLKFYDEASVPPIEVLDTAAPGRAYLSETVPWEEKEIAVDEGTPVVTFHENVWSVIAESAHQIVTLESACEIARIIDAAKAKAGR